MYGLMLCFPGGAQEDAVRAELPVAEGDSPFEVITLGQMGVLVVMRQNEIASFESNRRGEQPWRSIWFYDENLRQRWRADIEVSSAYRYLGHRAEADSVRFVLAALPEKADKKETPVFLELAVCMADGRYRLREHSLETASLQKASVAGIRPAGRYWYFLAVQKSEYFYGRFDADNDTLYRYPIASAKDFDCCDWQADSLGNACFLFRDAKVESPDLFYAEYTATGEERHRARIQTPRNDIRLTDACLIRTGENKAVVGGSWNLVRGKQTVSPYDRGTETMGLFALLYEDGEVRNFWMQAYLDYPFLDTLLGGKEKYRFTQARQKANGRVIMPDYLCRLYFKPFGNGFSLTGEIYDRVVTTTTEVSYDFYGRMMPYTRVNFDGFRYQNAFFSVFDSMGGNICNSVFDIEHDELYEALSPFTVAVENTAGALLYGYINKGSVYYRNTHSADGIGAIHSFRLSPLLSGDRMQKTWKEGLSEWYPGCILAYGYQQILNSRRKGKGRQSVFYMNKIMVEGKAERPQ